MEDNKRIKCHFSGPFTFQSKCLMYFLFSSSLNSKIPLSITVHSSKDCHKKLIILHRRELLCKQTASYLLPASLESVQHTFNQQMMLIRLEKYPVSNKAIMLFFVTGSNREWEHLPRKIMRVFNLGFLINKKVLF